MSALDVHIQSFKRQIDASPWLKWAGLAIALLLAAFTFQGLDAWRVTRQKASIEAEQNLRRTLALKGQDAWLARAKSSEQLRRSLEAQLPQVATPGMAQAAMQNWLQGSIAAFDAKKETTIRINRSAPVDAMPGILRVNAALNGRFSPRQAITLLRQIETAPNLVVVETITLESNDSNTLHLTLNAYYRVAGEVAP